MPVAGRLGGRGCAGGAVGRFHPVERRSEVEGLADRYNDLRSLGQGYVEVRLSNGEFPTLVLAFRDDHAVVQLMSPPERMSPLAGDGTVPLVFAARLAPVDRRRTGVGTPFSRGCGNRPRRPVTSRAPRPRSVRPAESGAAGQRRRPAAASFQAVPAGLSGDGLRLQRQQLSGHVVVEDVQDALQTKSSSTVHGRVLTTSRTAQPPDRSRPTGPLRQVRVTSFHGRTRSRPGPPSRTSFPVPPQTRSSPPSPSSVSLPEPPRRMSRPSPPMAWSSPGPACTVSSPP